jgi:predicted site-specific integrase-resolvase
MEIDPDTSPNVTDLARLVDCLDEQSVAKLAGVKVSTLDAWRKRGKGPEYILLGRNYLYPISAVQKYILGLVRTRVALDPQLLTL